jgi:hypothetical protein
VNRSLECFELLILLNWVKLLLVLFFFSITDSDFKEKIMEITETCKQKPEMCNAGNHSTSSEPSIGTEQQGKLFYMHYLECKILQKCLYSSFHLSLECNLRRIY